MNSLSSNNILALSLLTKEKYTVTYTGYEWHKIDVQTRTEDDNYI